MARPLASRRRFLRTLLASVPMVPGVPALRAVSSHAAQRTPPLQTGPWRTLFDGNTLTGWHTNPTPIEHGTGGHWQVDRGTLTGEQDPPGSGNGGILLTDSLFADFEVQVDIKPDWGVDTGLLLRCNDKRQCFQVMIDYHDHGNVGHLTSITGQGPLDFNTRTFDIQGQYDATRQLQGLTTSRHQTPAAGGLEYSCTPAVWLKTWKRDDWNTLRVRVAGQFPTIATWLNNVPICVFDGENSTNKLYRKEQLFQTLGRKGSIALQTYHGSYCPEGSKSRWKNMQLRELGR